jgi:hypothetical protein
VHITQEECDAHGSYRLYNKITTRIKQLDSFRDFKRKLKLILLDHPLYSLNEFFIFEEDNRTNK